ncbi:MAG: hypothetical protein M3Z23_13015 [Acidobacteriota bacterium]|nr:hypothetical protein [Acidobacteriota bacterium]
MAADTYRFIIVSLCVWRVTHLLAAEDGPWDIVLSVRRRVHSKFWAGLLDCFYCLSLWVSLPFAWLDGKTSGERAYLWLALSAAAILVDRFSARHAAEEGGVTNVLLRSRQSSTEERSTRPEAV